MREWRGPCASARCGVVSPGPRVYSVCTALADAGRRAKWCPCSVRAFGAFGAFKRSGVRVIQNKQPSAKEKGVCMQERQGRAGQGRTGPSAARASHGCRTQTLTLSSLQIVFGVRLGVRLGVRDGSGGWTLGRV